MCFSATASFMAAGVTALVGTVTLTRVESARALPLAAMPMIFAVQQTVEGVLWLKLEGAHVAASADLTFLFLIFAYVFWPIYTPIAVLLLETQRARKRALLLSAGAGLGLGAHLLWWLLTHPHAISANGHHLVYNTGYIATVPVALAYFIGANFPLMLSSHRWIQRLGFVIFAGSAIAYLSYWAAFVSVWCFFAAAASVMILGHFETGRRAGRKTRCHRPQGVTA